MFQITVINDTGCEINSCEVDEKEISVSEKLAELLSGDWDTFGVDGDTITVRELS